MNRNLLHSSPEEARLYEMMTMMNHSDNKSNINNNHNGSSSNSELDATLRRYLQMNRNGPAMVGTLQAPTATLPSSLAFLPPAAGGLRFEAAPSSRYGYDGMVSDPGSSYLLQQEQRQLLNESTHTSQLLLQQQLAAASSLAYPPPHLPPAHQRLPYHHHQDPMSMTSLNLSSQADAILAAASLEQRRRDLETIGLLSLLDQQQRSLVAASGGAGQAIHLPHHHNMGMDSAALNYPALGVAAGRVNHVVHPVMGGGAAGNNINNGAVLNHHVESLRRMTPATTPVLSPPPHISRTRQLPKGIRSVLSSGSRSRISVKCDTPGEATRTLKIIGSTLRGKGDPYLDASLIPDPGATVSVRGGRSEYFPDKVHTMLQEVENEEAEDLVSWLPHGRAFLIRDTEQFAMEVMPRYFNSLTQYSSFTRQLHLWGFGRMLTGPDTGAYYHELFLRGHPNLATYMRRVGAPRGVDRRKIKTLESEEPDFYAMRSLPPVPTTMPMTVTTTSPSSKPTGSATVIKSA